MTGTVIGTGWLQRAGDEWRGEVLLSGTIRMPLVGRLVERDGKPALEVELFLPPMLDEFMDEGMGTYECNGAIR